MYDTDKHGTGAALQAFWLEINLVEVQSGPSKEEFSSMNQWRNLSAQPRHSQRNVAIRRPSHA